MITKNYKKLAATMLLATPGAPWWIDYDNQDKLCTLVNTNGEEFDFKGWYGGDTHGISGHISFPFYVIPPIYNGDGLYNQQGIIIGSNYDSTLEPDDAYAISNAIGVEGSASFYDAGMDAQGNPYITFRCTITAESNFDMCEIGYAVNIPFQDGGSNSESILIDRTVLNSRIAVRSDTPVTFDYTLKAIWN